MSSAGDIIYKAFAPTIKMMICIALGVVIAKRGMFPPHMAKGVSILSLNIGLPSLTFSSMVTALDLQNIAAAGSLVLVAFLYQFLGLLLAFVCRELFYVPADFRWGILVMGIISNWGNLPTAVIQTLGQSSPFNPAVDVELGVAYVAIFILIMNTTLFPLGTHKLCALDFKEENLSRGRPLPFKQRWRRRLNHLRRKSGDQPSPSPETPVEIEEHHSEKGDEPRAMRGPVFTSGVTPTRKVSRANSFTSMLGSTRPIPPTEPLDSANSGNNVNPLLPVCPRPDHGKAQSFHHPASPEPSLHQRTVRQRLWAFIANFLNPVTVSIVLGIVCSIVPPVKALFVEVDGWTSTRIPNAPDGKPPLAFITDTTTFLGGMTVPANLVLLGASFARLQVPRRWRDQPLAALLTMTAVKMIIVPVFGIFLVQALRDRTSLFPKDDRMRTFAAILTSGTPAAVNQLVVTQLYNPEGSAHTLATFLLVQYLAMPVLSTALAAIGLYVVQSA